MYPLFCILGPSGVGKTTVVKAILAAAPELWELVSTTTRAPRVGESEGDPYYFASREAFDELEAAGGFIQTVEFGGNKYGTSLFDCLFKLKQGPTIVIVDGEGPKNFKRQLTSPVITIFLEPENSEVLATRMRARGDSEVDIAKRAVADVSITRARAECDFVITSSTIPETRDQLLSLIRKQAQAA